MTGHRIFVRLGAFILIAFSPIAKSAEPHWEGIPTRDNRGTVLIQTSWVDGTNQYSGLGTGFVASANGMILTVAHQFPSSPSATMFVVGETESGQNYPRQHFNLKLVKIDREADIALLVPLAPASPTLTPVPMKWDWKPVETDPIYVRGFPLGGSLTGMEGIVTRSGTSDKVPTSTLLRAGESGAPVYGIDGSVVAIARGGELVANLPKDGTVIGLGYLAPLSLLKDAVAKLSPGLTEANAASPAGVPAGAGGANRIRVAYPIDRTKETLVGCGPSTLFDGPSAAAQTVGPFQAQPGYRIESYDLSVLSANHESNRDISIAPDGSTISISFTLTSGPPCDRTRGWLAATLTTVQVPK